MMQEHCHDEAASHQLPMTAAFWIIRIVSTEESSSLMQTVMQTCFSTHPVILNATATQYTCSLNSVYHPHWLMQWSRHCSHMCIPVHSPWLPGSINVVQTILIIFTMAGLFQNRPHIHTHIYIHTHKCGYCINCSATFSVHLKCLEDLSISVYLSSFHSFYQLYCISCHNIFQFLVYFWIFSKNFFAITNNAMIFILRCTYFWVSVYFWITGF